MQKPSKKSKNLLTAKYLAIISSTFRSFECRNCLIAWYFESIVGLRTYLSSKPSENRDLSSNLYPV